LNCEERDILKHVRRRSKAWVPRRLNLTGTTKQQSVEIIWFGVHRRIGDRHKCNGRIRPSPADLSQGHEVVGTRMHIAGILYHISTCCTQKDAKGCSLRGRLTPLTYVPVLTM